MAEDFSSESDRVSKDDLYRWTEDKHGNIAILQGESLLYDDFNFATISVAKRAVRLLNEGRGQDGWDELFDCLIEDGCVESGSGCMRAPEDFSSENDRADDVFCEGL